MVFDLQTDALVTQTQAPFEAEVSPRKFRELRKRGLGIPLVRLPPTTPGGVRAERYYRSHLNALAAASLGAGHE